MKKICVVEITETRKKQVALEFDFNEEEYSANGYTPNEIEAKFVDAALEAAEDVYGNGVQLDDEFLDDWEIEFVKTVDVKTLNDLGRRFDFPKELGDVRYRESIY